MRPPRYSLLVEKSLSACLASIEIYNKPDFRYREESFSILMLNAWELLLKARVMQEHAGSFRAIMAMEPKKNKSGRPGKRLQLKKNRSGNAMTIDIRRAAELVRQYPSNAIDERCLDNLHILMEIRDNSVHLHNVDPGLGKRIQEVGSASLKNYMHAIQQWFGTDLSNFNFYLMPLAFHSPAMIIESLASNRQPEATRKLLNLIAEAERRHPSEENRDFNVTMRVELRFVRAAGANAVPVQMSRDPTAIPVQLAEEDIRQQYPWDYATLCTKVRERYSNFVLNNKFHAHRRPLEKDQRLCRVRYLDPGNPRSGKKQFYSPNILPEFDTHYIRRAGS